MFSDYTMSIWIIASISLIIIFAVFQVYMKYVKATCHCQVDLSGKTALVTGSDKGNPSSRNLISTLRKWKLKTSVGKGANSS